MMRFLQLLLLLIPVLLTVKAYALDMSAFRQIPIAHEGRIKPLDSFARTELKKLSGRDSIEGKTASEFLASILFNPGKAMASPVFLIENEVVRHRLGLTERKNFLYHFEEILPGLQKTSPSVTSLLQKDRGALAEDDRALLDIHENAMAFTALLRSLSLLLPLNIELPEKYHQFENQTVSFLDLKKMEQDLSSDLQEIVRKKGDDFETYNDEEKRTALTAFQISIMAGGGVGNNVFKIIPPQWSSQTGDWSAPWEILQSGEGSPQSARLIALWRDLWEYYSSDNKKAWLQSSMAARDLALSQTRDIRPWQLHLEILQNDFPPFFISLVFYTFSFAVLLAFFVFEKKFLYKAAAGLLISGAVFHSIGMACRIFILMRPPVGTLYESLIFVSLCVILISLPLEKIFRNGAGFLIGTISAISLSLISYGFKGESDTLQNLTAVLNTNFWLATHVLCITLGYGWCVLTSILAHISLASKKFNLEKLNSETASSALHTLAILALLFTAIGTILGGIWADQSWGRFWGWDPKENGALIIVLWLVWALHGKLGGQLKETGFLASLALLNIVVALSWIGVNLLGVGLHSYGFSEGMYYGLGLFILAEIALIASLSIKRHA